ncbi:FAD-binding protein, partial [Streptomyces sp. NPDC060286]|uniref:FAD-binding protein n=1 Tax=unclassified Streptomyces TaxID=2593676 RepID=UPI0035DDACFE
MSAQASHYESDALPTETVDVVVIGGGAAGLNGALMLARSRRLVVVIDSGTPRNAPAAAVHGFIVLDGTPPPHYLLGGPAMGRPASGVGMTFSPCRTHGQGGG